MWQRQNRPISRADRQSRMATRLMMMVTACVLLSTCSLQAALPSGMAAYYRFNATSGLTAVDETGNHNGTLTGPLNWVPGVNGNALQFRGGNGSPFVNLGAWQTNGPAGLSLCLWVKWAGANSLYQGLIGQRQGTMYWWSEISTNSAELRFKSNTSPQSNLFLTTPHLIQNEWVHVAFSHDAVARRGTVYLNGAERLAGAWSLPTGTFSNLNSGIGVVNTADGLGTFNGLIDEAMIFQVPLSAAEVKTAMSGYSDPVATDPSPADGQADVRRDVVLAWTPAETAGAHDVYFGTSADIVGVAGRTNPSGVLVSQNQDANTYDPTGALELGKTYYWRIDEVNAPPVTAVFKGRVWSFTTEPFAYPITKVTATASSSQAGMGPEKTVDGSGLDASDQHSTVGTDMWLSNITGPQPTWIQYEFDAVYKLHEMWVWNSNQLIETTFGLGVKAATVEYSTDGSNWTALAGVSEFAQANGLATYEHNTTVNLGGATAKYVRITAASNFGGFVKQYGLSEVRFFYVPVQAREPDPASAKTGVAVDAVLTWRPGREAASHKVYFSTDKQAVADGAALVATTGETSYQPDALEFGRTYYWRIAEVNEAQSPQVWEGEIWSFSTTEYVPVDDFESYTDKEGSRIYETWIDGWTNGTGSVVGYLQAPFAEQTILHGGGQSMPLEYNNVKAPFYSETERVFDTAQNWTANGADTLSLYVRGRAPAFVETAEGRIFMGGIGADIWGTADEFRFAYQQLNGNGSITARVVSVARSDAWAKAGVMIRESIEPGSPHAFVAVTPDNGVAFQDRPAANQASVNVNQTGLTAPYWVRLTRTGNSFTAKRSDDGVTWVDITTTAAPVTIPMAANVFIGLALTSHNATVATSAEFSDVTTTGNVTGQWQTVGIGVEQPAGNTLAPLYVALEDTSKRVKAVQNPDVAAAARTDWQQWTIPLSEFSAGGVKLTGIKKIYIGLGDRNKPTPGGAGMLYIDDIAVGRPAQ